MSDATTLDAEVILVYLRNAGPTAQAGIALLRPRVETLLGDQFLVGEVPANRRDWASGLKAAVRLEEVQHLLFFKSISEYETSVAGAPAAWELSQGDSEPS